MSPVDRRRGGTATTQKIDLALNLALSDSAAVKARRTVTLEVDGDSIAAMEVRLLDKLTREFAEVRQAGRLLLRIAHWREQIQGEFDALVSQDVAIHIDLRSDGDAFTVDFVAEYLAADLAPLVHSVEFPLGDGIPPVSAVVERLEKEWRTLQRVFVIAHAAGDGATTKAVPPPFLDSKPRVEGVGTDRDVQPMARAASPEEGKKYIERYLDLFKFPFEIEEKGIRYGFIPRVEISKREQAIKMTVTVLVPPKGRNATFMKGGSKSVVVPLSEIYVQGEELNRKTQEGILAILKGLCRTLGKEKGLTVEVDITRPR